jgi:uncharacterized protein YlxP (DUF503 family)
MVICSLTCQIQIPGCRSLKEKRSQIKPLVERLRREFNVSAAEIDRLDSRDNAVIGCVMVSNQHAFSEKCMQQVIGFIEERYQNLQIVNFRIEWY